MYLKSIYNENILININDLTNFLKQKSDNTLDDYILSILKKTVGNKCNKDGLLIENSIHIIYRNCGEFRFNEKILYKIKYSADILYPTEGCLLENCKLIYISNILYIAKVKDQNLIVILPKSFMKTNLDIKKKHVNVICLDKYYELNDRYMFIIGIPFIESLNMQNITDKDIDDIKCRNIFEEVTQLKEEFQSLFDTIDDEEDTDDKFEIMYDFNKKDKQNNILKNLLQKINTYINSNSKNITIKLNTTNITEIEDIYNILDLLNISFTDDLYLSYKKEIYSHFDEKIYNKNKNTLTFGEFRKTNNLGIIINELSECYIISALQILKNCKIFISKLTNILETINLKTDRYTLLFELYNLLTEKTIKLDNFIDIVNKYILLYKLDFNLNTFNNISDFIHILFYLIDTEIDIKLYIHNVYSDIKKEYLRGLKKTNNTHNISHYINTLETINSNSILNNFYKINTSEYKCTECGFRYYHIKNKLLTSLNINQNDNISKCFHDLNKTSTYINGLECHVCNTFSIEKNSYFYMNPTDYLLCDLNRILFKSENELKQNRQSLFINNRIYIKILNKKSTHSIICDDFTLDLKSIVCKIGTINNGHYIALNRTKEDIFYLYNDEHKLIVFNEDFYDNNLFKGNVSNLVYQLNHINSPFSDINLLEFEEEYLENPQNTLLNRAGINIKMLGGASKQIIKNKLESLFELKLISSRKFIEFFNEFYSSIDNIDYNQNDDDLLEKINEIYDQNEIKINSQNIYFMNKIIIEYVNDLRYKILNKTLDPNVFLSTNPHIDFLYDKNMYIGSTGYNTNKTNHWDIIYEVSDNTLDYYTQHFNTIEINDTYYNDFDVDYWEQMKLKLNKIETGSTNLNVSFIFNKKLSDVINSRDELSQSIIEEEFNKYWNNKINLIADDINNIVFIFESNFVYNEINFDKIKLLQEVLHPHTSKINFVFEFYNNSWYNNTVASFFIQHKLSYVTLILNNKNNEFGYNLDDTNIPFISKYINDDESFPISYIKLYGSIQKYNGSHKRELPKLIEYIKQHNFENKTHISLLNPKKPIYIYFNNIETDLNNKRYTYSNLIDLSDTITSDDDELYEHTTYSEQLAGANISINKNGPEAEDEVETEVEVVNEAEDENEVVNEAEAEVEDEAEAEVEDEVVNEVVNEVEAEDENEVEVEDVNEDEDGDENGDGSLDMGDTETSSENLNIPSAVFDAKCLHKLLYIMNLND